MKVYNSLHSVVLSRPDSISQGLCCLSVESLTRSTDVFEHRNLLKLAISSIFQVWRLTYRIRLASGLRYVDGATFVVASDSYVL